MSFQAITAKPIPSSSRQAIEVTPFRSTLNQHHLELFRKPAHTLQINLGFLCNQTCRHCHLYARRSHFKTIDITGGAPELNSHLSDLIAEIFPYAQRIMLRSNLSALSDKMNQLIDPLKSRQVVIVASFPALNAAQTEAQRGKGIFEKSIKVLKKLNSVGYGFSGSGLELNLVSNPTGAFLPPNQEQTEKRYHQVMKQRWGILFNHLYSFANAPVGRFRQWLIQSGNFESYLHKLVSNFNPCAIEDLMCRTLVSVSWDGYLYDCDFNLARSLYMGGNKIHVSEMPGPPEPGSAIITADHCYTCAAGSGFT
jgi:radical SAM/Cys-rich protein